MAIALLIMANGMELIRQVLKSAPSQYCKNSASRNERVIIGRKAATNDLVINSNFRLFISSSSDPSITTSISPREPRIGNITLKSGTGNVK